MKKKEKNNKSLEELKSDLINEYNNNPRRVSRFMFNSLYKLGIVKPGKAVPKKVYVIIFIMFALLCIGCKFDDFPFYLFGMVFFVAGYLAGLVGGMSKLFFFTHGLTGSGFMIAGLFMNANYNSLELYFLIFTIVLYVIGTIVYVLKDKPMLATKDYVNIYPLIIFFIALFILRISPYIINFMMMR